MNIDITSLSKKQLLALADQLKTAQRYPDLALVLERICAMLPKSPVYHERLGQLYMKLGSYAKAEKSLKHVIQLQKSPKLELQLQFGRCLLKSRKIDDAAELLGRIYDSGAVNAEAQNLLAQILYFKGDVDGALSLLEKARVAFPQDSNLAFAHAEQLFVEGQYAEAARAAETAIQLGGTTIAAYRILGRALIFIGDLDKAYGVFRKIFEPYFDDAMSSGIWLDSLVAKIGLEGAIAWLQGQGLDPEEDPIRGYHLAMLLFRAGNLQEAMAAVKAAQKRQPSSRLLLSVSTRISAAMGDWECAVTKADQIWDMVAKETDAGFGKALEKKPPALPGNLHKLIYMPVEVAQREFDSRLIVAFRAATKGVTTVIGSRHVIDDAAADLPPGLFFFKTMNFYDKVRAQALSKTQHRIAALDEEELGAYGDPELVVVGMDPDIVNAVDLVMTNNEAHQQAIQAVYPDLAERSVITGNPRLELLDSKFNASIDSEAGSIRSKYGRTVLICTNFGGFASLIWDYFTTCGIMLKALNRAPSTPFGKKIVQMGRDYSLSEARSMAALGKFIPEVASEFPDTTFIVRTHPSESPEIWRNKFANVDNVEVSPAGSLQGWIKASTAVIYFAGCMTGVEATLSGVPAIRFDAGPDLDFPKLGVSAHINPSACTGGDLIKLLHDIYAGNLGAWRNSVHDREILEKNILVEPPSPSIRCADALAAFLESMDPLPVTEEVVSSVQKALKSGLAVQRLRISRGDMVGNVKKVATKFEEVESRRSRWQNVVGEFSKVRVEELSEGVFLIGSR